MFAATTQHTPAPSHRPFEEAPSLLLGPTLAWLAEREQFWESFAVAWSVVVNPEELLAKLMRVSRRDARQVPMAAVWLGVLGF